MRFNLKTGFNTLIVACVVAPHFLYCQSSKESGVVVTKSEAVSSDDEKLQVRDLDSQIGKVLLSENGKVYALTSSYELNAQWDFYFYAMDERYVPVARLEPTLTFYKNIRLFRVVEGDVKKGDLIFLKQIAPRPIQNEELNESD